MLVTCLTSFFSIFNLFFFVFFSVLGCLGMSYSGMIPPRGAGFYCDDQSIRHVYRGDTISVINLFAVTLFAPILFVSRNIFRVTCLELSSLTLIFSCQIFPIETYWKKRKHAEIRSYLTSGWKKAWKIWQALLLGELLVLMLTEFSKSIISEPRPHFWDSCKPNVTKEICDTGYPLVLCISLALHLSS